MVRFIFVCMAIVALSIITLASQYMLDGIKEAQQYVELRNTEPQPQESVAAVETPAPAAFSPEALNSIDTAAGAAATDKDDSFKGGFTDVAPKALGDNAPAIAPADLSTPSADSAN